jgi:hypothetical protein
VGFWGVLFQRRQRQRSSRGTPPTAHECLCVHHES